MIRPYTDSTGRKEIIASHLLLVEGKDEINLLTGLISACFVADDDAPLVQIEQVGKDNLRRNLSAIVMSARKRVTLQAIGIVRDAGEDAEHAFESVCDGIRYIGHEPPRSHGLFTDESPAVGIFISPDGVSPGAVEALCRSSAINNAAGQCVEAYLGCLREYDVLLSANEDKSFAHAYLSALRDPVARVGEGALQGAWDFSSEAFAELQQFVRDLVSKGAVPI